MSSTPAGTPRRSTVNYESATPLATPQTSRLSATTANIIQSSPHYTTTRRHSLYGTEDRIILDPGSRIWKVGFSGEGKPRDVFLAGADTGQPLWTLNRATIPGEKEEEDKLLEARLQKCLRSVFHEYACCIAMNARYTSDFPPGKLSLDRSEITKGDRSRAATVASAHQRSTCTNIIQQPTGAYNNLNSQQSGLNLYQVPSISFASSHLLALLAAGRITGLVVDCGHLESIALPVGGVHFPLK